jgi:hypothetical protein
MQSRLVDILNMSVTDSVLVFNDDVMLEEEIETRVGCVFEMHKKDFFDSMMELRDMGRKFSRVIVEASSFSDEKSVLDAVSFSSGIVSFICKGHKMSRMISESIERNYPIAQVWVVRHGDLDVVMTDARGEPIWWTELGAK